jgi:uncharacterized membrane protein
MQFALAAVLALGLLASAWSAGFFWSWSFTVMPGLDRAPAETAIVAMNRVNEGIRTAGFAFVFFGPLPLAALTAATAFTAGSGTAALLALASAVAYAAGVIGVTVMVNLPLNDGLAAAPVTPDSAARIWNEYSSRWTAWTHLRTGAATLAFGLLVLAALRAARG